MGFLNGFLIGYFWRSIAAVLFIFGALSLIGYGAEQLPPVQAMVASFVGSIIILPLIVCMFHRRQMRAAGLPAMTLIILRGLYYLVGFIALCVGAYLLYRPDAAGTAAERRAEIEAQFGGIDGLADLVMSLPPAAPLLIIGTVFSLTAFAINRFATKERRALWARIDNHQANVIAEGIRRSQT